MANTQNLQRILHSKNFFNAAYVNTSELKEGIAKMNIFQHWLLSEAEQICCSLEGPLGAW